LRLRKRRPHAVPAGDFSICTSAWSRGALSRCGVTDKVAAEVVKLAVGGDEHGLSGVYRRMEMTVNEPGRHQLAARIDCAINFTFEATADVDDSVGFEDNVSVWEELVSAPVVAYDPTTLNQRAHRLTSMMLRY
jgi:hypothetical protein